MVIIRLYLFTWTAVMLASWLTGTGKHVVKRVRRCSGVPCCACGKGGC